MYFATTIGDAAEATAETPLESSDLDARFADFVATHRDKARRTAWRLVGGDESAADDVAQDAFVKAYAGLDRFREDAKLETWFYSILVRQAQSYLRWRRVRTLWGGLGGENAPEVPEPRSTQGDPMLRRRIGLALGRLSAGQREAFVLVQLEGFTVTEAANVTGRAPGTVKSHLARALKALRADLGDLRTEGEGSDD